jgi:hypothetical protein
MKTKPNKSRRRREMRRPFAEKSLVGGCGWRFRARRLFFANERQKVDCYPGYRWKEQRLETIQASAMIRA